MNKKPDLATLLSSYQERWSNCTGCALHACRDKPVLWRGSIPCDVALLGEAPGQEENREGKPFVGDSGKILDHILNTLSKELSIYGVECRFLILNVLVCYPGKDKRGNFNRPTPEQSLTCRPHVSELLKIAKPRLLIPLGKTAQEQAKGLFRGATLQDVWHPSYLLRGGGIRGERYRITYNKISKAVSRLYARGE